MRGLADLARAVEALKERVRSVRHRAVIWFGANEDPDELIEAARARGEIAEGYGVILVADEGYAQTDEGMAAWEADYAAKRAASTDAKR